jgi:membrane associated rhomboid family serine protease
VCRRERRKTFARSQVGIYDTAWSCNESRAMIVPYRVNTLTVRNPWANLVILALNIGCFVLVNTGQISIDWVERLVLQDWSALGLLGHQFLHAGWMHLLGNMIGLWVFGNALNGVISNLEYAVIYLLCGVLAAALHLMIDGAPAVGASGAIAGLFGLYLAIYPKNEISCWYWFFQAGTFEMKGYILIIVWFIWEIVSGLRGVAGIASWAHVGGLIAGFGAGLVLLKLQRVELGDYDNPTVIDIFSRSK